MKTNLDTPEKIPQTNNFGAQINTGKEKILSLLNKQFYNGYFVSMQLCFILFRQ
ncbi:hypothetical protein [Pedobacter duraquae]|uniref:Uncharacterized protein n=1 Tax=Pedobacter duraquae TaxID=425511 RepID=A0A4R6IF96_9SPHI|nr:hypothetical protein [Pedobacter duraquae]TDO20742.1 hypothetical protein CLV32_3375 [Pedobacter duraquae]